MPSLNRLWAESKDKGLHIFHIESQGHSADEIRAFCEKNGMEFPNPVGRSGFSGYSGFSGLPYAFVIGVDGKIAYQGRSGYKAVIHEELAKVRYPGLGKLEVAKPMHKAALYFGAKQFAKAIATAEKERGKLDEADEDFAAASEDAEYIIARALSRGEKIRTAIDEAKEARDYDIALARLAFLSASFKGHEIGDTAKEESKTLQKDADVKKELRAFAALDNLEGKLAKEHDPAKKKATYQAFADEFEGTRAAERARAKAN